MSIFRNQLLAKALAIVAVLLIVVIAATWLATDKATLDTNKHSMDFDRFRKLPDEAKLIIDHADHMELISLDPGVDSSDEAKKFHGWRVLGKTSIDDLYSRKKIASALYQGILESQGVAACFEPRHGIRAIKGSQKVDLVICFRCASMDVYLGDHHSSVWTSASPQQIFDGILTKAKLPLAPKPTDE